MGRYGRTLRVKILRSVLLTVALPAFVSMLLLYVGWNAYVRERITRDLARSTGALASGLEADLGAYDGLLLSLAADGDLAAALEASRPGPAVAEAMGRIYGVLKDRRVKAVVRGLDPRGRQVFGTMAALPGAEEGDEGLGWGLAGLMEASPGTVRGYQRSLRFGKLAQTDYSLGLALPGPGGGLRGYLVADLTFQGSQGLSRPAGGGVTARYLLANEFDRVVAAYDGSAIGAFDRFALPGPRGQASLEGVSYAYARREVGRHGLVAYGLSSIDFILSSFRFGLYTIGVILLLFSGVFVYILSRSVARLTRPVNGILEAMGRVSQGDFGARLSLGSGDEFDEIAQRLNALIEEMGDTVERLVEGRELAKAAELKRLQAQFDPHFLYNTIDTTKWMIKMGEADKAAQMLTNMAKVLRYSLHDRVGSDLIPLREDLVAIKTYLEIHELSLGDRLVVGYEVDPAALPCRVPKLLIQPLVENALIHGIGSVGEGRLDIAVGLEGEVVRIEVRDSGPGFAVDATALDRAVDGRGEASMGLGLVLRRARLHYGEAFSYTVSSSPGAGTRVVLRLPRTVEGEPCIE